MNKFLDTEQPFWQELETILKRIDHTSIEKLTIKEIQRFHYLFRRTLADLSQIHTFAAESELVTYLENIIAQAYSQIYVKENSNSPTKILNWFFVTFPQTFRRHRKAFYLSLTLTIVGAIVGAGLTQADKQAKKIILPFSHIQGNPSERVKDEETRTDDHMKGHKTTFAAQLMTHNTKVSITTASLGVTWGFGTFVLLFYNGVILGAVSIDYIMAGETKFLIGWLLPHGSVEIPSILIAGQIGFIIASALIGWRKKRLNLKMRLREISKDLLTLIGGITILLIWAGIIESFLSQYHEPYLSYNTKILFGSIQLLLLTIFLTLSGSERFTKKKPTNNG